MQLADRLRAGRSVRPATVGSSWVDGPSPGGWSYRPGLSANWLNDPTLSDALVLSGATMVTVRR
jgi:hypothetical protein